MKDKLSNRYQHYSTHILPFIFAILTIACAQSGNSIQKQSAIAVIQKEITRHYQRLPTRKVKSAQSPAAIIYHSVDSGTTWEPYVNGIPADATVSGFVTGDSGAVLATTDAHGIYFIREGEPQWQRVDFELPYNIEINAVAATFRGDVIIGTFAHGIRVSKYGLREWINPDQIFEGTPVRALLGKGYSAYAGSDNGIYKSHNGGETWRKTHSGVQVNGFAERGDKIYAAMMNGAMMSNDKGETWKYIYEGGALHDISTDARNIYAMTMGEGLLKSGNDGLTWDNINNGLGNLYTFEVKTFHNKIFAAQWYGIYESSNGGKSWQRITNGLPDSTAFTTLERTSSGMVAGIGLRK